ncbi:unnamed protein product [Oikopleura dioica]|uniref:TAZ-type domain-containing protein n=1 Tax=Oikopleura dioica TaxID=34765 RepID=E4XVM2_OIKDI|nr:unnamed protein product [Oikopleura dioica]
MPSDDALEPEKELAELAHAAECKKCHRQFCRHKKQMIKHFALCPHAKKLKVSPKRRVICGVCKVYLRIHEFHFDTGRCSGSLCPLPDCEEIQKNPPVFK